MMKFKNPLTFRTTFFCDVIPCRSVNIYCYQTLKMKAVHSSETMESIQPYGVITENQTIILTLITVRTPKSANFWIRSAFQLKDA
jgi:hypothetical protein